VRLIDDVVDRRSGEHRRGTAQHFVAMLDGRIPCEGQKILCPPLREISCPAGAETTNLGLELS
jgi:hypothetical protein